MAVIFLTVFSHIQMGYAEKEKEKAIAARFHADNNATLALEQSMNTARAIEEAMSEAELLKAKLEACKGKK